MNAQPVIAVFDVGKTNKKLFLFDEQYRMVYEESMQFAETVDEAGFPCEDVHKLTDWIRASFNHVLSLSQFDVRAVNFSAYGASFVHVDGKGEPVAPLYNYLKPYPENLQKTFYNKYGGEEVLSRQTASPVLGSLTSGLQLYRIKYEQPDVFENIQYSLHLPQYLSFILSQKATTDLTSVGCHTLLWDFEKGDYHDWVKTEGLDKKFAPIYPGNETLSSKNENKEAVVGIGLHDSSAALIPYLASFQEPFVLISTGTWCISLNPFNETLLTNEELQEDCLCYLTYQGKPVKASRLFAGNEHEQQTKKLAAHFGKDVDHYKTVRADFDLLNRLQDSVQHFDHTSDSTLKESAFAKRKLEDFASYEEAYHQLITDIVAQQIQSTQLVLKGADAKRIFVDGGFSKNPIYMHLLAKAFPEKEVFAASLAQATAMGAALAIHTSWNSKNIPDNLIELKSFSARTNASPEKSLSN